MKVVIDIPEEFESHFELDKFNESLCRLRTDIHCVAGKYEQELCDMIIEAFNNGTPLPKENKCKWINYDYRTVCPKEHDIDNPYWRIPESRMDVLKFCPYCGKEIELEADTGEDE